MRDSWNEVRGEISDSSLGFLKAGINESLKRLGTDYIDVYIVHWPDPTLPYEVPMRVLQEAKMAGKIRHYGVSNFNTEELAACLKHGQPICDQAGYHIFDRRAEHQLFPFVQHKGIGIMAYGPMGHGLLTGTWNPCQHFGCDDWRAAVDTISASKLGRLRISRKTLLLSRS